jgi:hypothetical protein
VGLGANEIFVGVGPQDTWTFLKPCDASTGSLQWMCSLSGDCTNSSLRFNLQVGSVREVNITGELVTSSSTSSSASITSPTSTSSTSITSSAASSSSTNECQTTKGTSVTAVGAGVAIPLGVLLLLALVWGFWERRKRTMMNTRVIGQDYSTVVVTENKYDIPQEAPSAVVRSKLPPYQRPNELP